MKKARILIVDDAKYIHDMIEEMLDINIYEVVGNADNGRQAVFLYKELHPDLVIMDMVMEDMDGLTATREIINYDQNAVILIITATTYSKNVKDVMAAGAKQHLWKPFVITNLLETVEELLREEKLKTISTI